MKETKLEPIILGDFCYEHGMHVTCEIHDIPIIGRISLEGKNAPYICQDRLNGAVCNNKFGYKYSWSVSTGIYVVKNMQNRVSFVMFDSIRLEHGMKVSCDILEHVNIKDAKISIDSNGTPYICQNETRGGITKNKFEYKFSWALIKNFKNAKVKNFKILEWWQNVKIGDELTCVPDLLSPSVGGMGFKPGRKFIVSSIDLHDIRAIFFSKNEHEVYNSAIVKPTIAFNLRNINKSNTAGKFGLGNKSAVLKKNDTLIYLIPEIELLEKKETFDPIINLGF